MKLFKASFIHKRKGSRRTLVIYLLLHFPLILSALLPSFVFILVCSITFGMRNSCVLLLGLSFPVVTCQALVITPTGYVALKVVLTEGGERQIEEFNLETNISTKFLLRSLKIFQPFD